LETHPQLGGDVIVDQASTASMMNNYRRRLQRWLVLQGMSAKTLPPAVVDPTPHVDKAIEAICIRMGCPIRVFKGSERGELASSQDDEDWNERRRARQETYLTPKLVCPFIDRLIQIGVLPEPEDGYHVEWPDVDALGKKDKAGIALQFTQALAQYVQSGANQVIPEQVYFTEVWEWEDEKTQDMLKEAEKKQEEMEQEHADLAEEQGMIPTPPPGFQHQPQPGQPGGPPLPPQAQAGQAMKAAKAEGDQPPQGVGSAIKGRAK
jgi:hypothetical protein